MSDGTSQVDIEDVLSSIRRLVAGHERTRRDQSGLNRPFEPQPNLEKLVLTPEQRIDAAPPHRPDRTRLDAMVTNLEAQIDDDPAGDVVLDERYPSEVPGTGLDEQALRGLVTDVLREELRGALGERITQSLRKALRQEIEVALEAERLKHRPLRS